MLDMVRTGSVAVVADITTIGSGHEKRLRTLSEHGAIFDIKSVIILRGWIVRCAGR